VGRKQTCEKTNLDRNKGDLERKTAPPMTRKSGLLKIESQSVEQGKSPMKEKE